MFLVGNLIGAAHTTFVDLSENCIQTSLANAKKCGMYVCMYVYCYECISICTFVYLCAFFVFVFVWMRK